VDEPGLPGDLVEVVAEGEPESGGEDGRLHQAPGLAGVVQHREDLLHPPEREDRDEHGAAALPGGVDRLDEPDDLGHPRAAGGPLGGAAGGLEHERVERPGGEFRRAEGALRGEEHVAGEEEAAVLVADFHAGGAGDVSGRVQGELELVVRAAEPPRLAEGLRVEARGAPLHLLVGEQRRLREALRGAFAQHDVDRIVQHPLEEEAAGLGHHHRRVRVRAQQHGQRADVVQVAVGDEDQVEAHARERAQVGHGEPAGELGVEAGVHHEVEVAELAIEAVGADAALAVQIDELHVGALKEADGAGGRKALCGRSAAAGFSSRGFPASSPGCARRCAGRRRPPRGSSRGRARWSR